MRHEDDAQHFILEGLHESPIEAFDGTSVPFLNAIEVLGDSALTWPTVDGRSGGNAALLDRLTHRAHILEFIGDSFRLRQSLKPSAKKR